MFGKRETTNKALFFKQFTIKNTSSSFIILTYAKNQVSFPIFTPQI